ncbi:MAG: RDD family protein [Chloroflexi bacterium]|nr:RDD family protein [Chloroflexota bacterium]
MILNRLTGGAVGSPDSPVQDVFIFFGYFVLFTGIFGQTPGKYAAGIVVVDRDGRVPSVALAIPREIAGRAIATAALGIGLLWIIYDQNRQGWHDKLAGTFVVTKPNSGVPGLLGRFMRKKRR